MTTDETQALDLYRGPGIVAPLVDVREAQRAIAQYEALKQAIVRPEDRQTIQGRVFLKKSFWRRVAAMFGLSLELVHEERGFDEGGKLFYSVIYRAIAPNGRSMTADGYCSQAEGGRGGWPEHNVRATAHTRAKNRAISDLVGGGEVSADEVPEYVEADEPQRPRQQQQQTRQASRPLAAKVEPAPVIDEGQPALPQQLNAIARLSEELGRPVPEVRDRAHAMFIIKDLTSEVKKAKSAEADLVGAFGERGN